MRFRVSPRPLFVIAVAILCLTASSVTAQTQTLRWNLKPGQKFKLEIEQNMTQKLSGPFGEQDIPMEMKMEMTWVVADVKKDEFKVEQVVDRVKMKVDSPFQTIEYDSAEKVDDSDFATKQVADSMSQIVGKKIVQTMNPRGQVLNIDLPPELENAEPNAQNPMSGETLKQLTSQAALVFPEGPIAEGEVWDSAVDVNMQGIQMKTKNKYRYDGTESVDGKELHKIHLTVDMDIEGAPQPGMEMKISDQKNEGDMYFDAREGRLHSATSKQDMKMTMSAQGQEMSMLITGTTKCTVTSVK